MYRHRIILTLIFCLLTAPAWGAQTVTWIGDGTNTNWSTANSWHGSVTDHVKPVNGDDVVFNNSTNCVVNENTALLRSLDMTGYTGTLSGSTQLNISGAASTTTNVILAGTYTHTGQLYFQLPISSSRVINFNPSGITSGGLCGLQLHPQSNTINFTGNATFTNLTSCGISIETSGTINVGGYSINGNSAINNILIRSMTLGTARTIANLGAVTNATFRDITSSTAKDFSAQTDIGDAGGNSGITFPASTTQTLTGSSANWSTASWTSRVPLCHDDVIISLTAGQTLTANMPRLGRNISFTTGTNFTLGNAVTSYGSLDFTGAGTFTPASKSWAVESSARDGILAITSAGKSFYNFYAAAYGATVQLQDDVTTTNIFDVADGTLQTNGKTVSTPTIGAYRTTTRTLDITNSTINISGMSAWYFYGSNQTVIADGSTLNFTGTSGTQVNRFNGKKYGNVNISAGGTFLISTDSGGSNTFNTFTLAAPKTVTFLHNATQTVNHLVADGDGSNQITINSSTGGTPATLRSTSTNALTYVTLQDINATGGTWKCLTGCNNTSGNSGMNFTWTDRARTNNARLNNYKKF